MLQQNICSPLRAANQSSAGSCAASRRTTGWGGGEGVRGTRSVWRDLQKLRFSPELLAPCCSAGPSRDADYLKDRLEARSRLYENRFLQEHCCCSALFKLYKSIYIDVQMFSRAFETFSAKFSATSSNFHGRRPSTDR